MVDVQFVGSTWRAFRESLRVVYYAYILYMGTLCKEEEEYSVYVGTKNRTITKCFKQNLHKFCGSKGLKNCHYPNEETMQIGSWPATQHTSKSFKIPTWLQTFIEASETHKWTVLSKSVSYVSLTSAHPRQKTIYCRLLAFAPPTQIACQNPTTKFTVLF